MQCMNYVQGSAKEARITSTTFYYLFSIFCHYGYKFYAVMFKVYVLAIKNNKKDWLEFCLFMEHFLGERLTLELPNTSTAPLLFSASYMRIGGRAEVVV